MSKFLEAIGLHAMTNREALMEELDALDDAAFCAVLFGEEYDRRAGINLYNVLSRKACEDCESQYGGKSPCVEDKGCPYTLNAWLAKECRHEKLIPEVTA